MKKNTQLTFDRDTIINALLNSNHTQGYKYDKFKLDNSCTVDLLIDLVDHLNDDIYKLDDSKTLNISKYH
jgi:hypothetical protein